MLECWNHSVSLPCEMLLRSSGSATISQGGRTECLTSGIVIVAMWERVILEYCMPAYKVQASGKLGRFICIGNIILRKVPSGLAWKMPFSEGMPSAGTVFQYSSRWLSGSIIPIFQYSIIPSFQYSSIPLFQFPFFV